MNQDPKFTRELQALKNRVAQLEAENKRDKGTYGRTFLEALISLLFGLFIVGPVIAIAAGVFVIIASWLGIKM
ncbi:hypothetical protein FZC66_05470 [Priestia megaterium]|nr:hypothetical protein FZC66_05470 [Priestia megaterium]